MLFVKKFATGAVALGMMAFGASSAMADTVVTDRLGYTGTVTRYDSLADAQNRVNGTSYDTGQRDLALYRANGGLVVMTAWYYTTDTSHSELSGRGNPNNTNVGFFQMYDLDGNTIDSYSSGFSADMTSFSMSATGSNAGSAEIARLWAAPESGAAAITAGVYHSYELDVTFSGLNGSRTGNVISATGHPGSVLGTFTAIFENTNANRPDLHGFYVADFEFNMNSWAFDNRHDLHGALVDSVFITVVPTPSAALAGFGLMGITALRRRRSL